jgi:hypothetical protein
VLLLVVLLLLVLVRVLVLVLVLHKDAHVCAVVEPAASTSCELPVITAILMAGNVG